MKNIENKVVVITGASSGIGEATARKLAAMGAKVVLGARREDRLRALVESIKNSGGQAAYTVTDVTRRADVDVLVQTAIDTFGGVDVLVNNAGLMPMTPLKDRHYEEWEMAIDINLKGVLYGIGAVLPEFYKKKAGHVISISSVAGHQTNYGGAVYAATKFGVRAIMDTLRKEAATDGTMIRSTIISPGAIDTELLGGILAPDIRKSFQEFYDNAAIPAESIADTIAFAIGEPEFVGINEILVRPTRQVV